MSVATEPNDPLAPPMTPAAFGQFVAQGQALKLLALMAACVLVVTRHVTPLDWALFAIMTGLTMLGVTAGLHRLFSHQSFQAVPALRAVLAVLATIAGQGSVLIWVAIHRRHHQHADRPSDPHSPHVAADGSPRTGLAGWWHAHTGWILAFYPQDLARHVPDLMREPLLVRLHERNVAVVWLGTLLPAVIGGCLSGSWWGALVGFVLAGWARMAVVEQATCMVNSLGHTWGTRPFDTHDHSTNMGPLALLTLGDGWHNNHHAFPASARHGLVWWQLDPTYWALCTWQALGWVSQVNQPEPARVAARRRP